jgi:diphthamide synthase subunit DPH2
VSACVRDHGVRRALQRMRHQIGEVGEEAAGELDHVVVGGCPRLKVDDEARLETAVEDEEVVAGVAL